MCGIIGALSVHGGDVPSYLISGLRRLAYRGYDSAGLVTLADKQFQRRRALGKLQNLETLLTQQPVQLSLIHISEPTRPY